MSLCASSGGSSFTGKTSSLAPSNLIGWCRSLERAEGALQRQRRRRRPGASGSGAAPAERPGRLREVEHPLHGARQHLSLIHISEPTRLGMISYAVFCLKKKNKHTTR